MAHPALERTIALTQITFSVSRREWVMWRLMRWKPNKVSGSIRFIEGTPQTRWESRKFKLTGALWCRISDTAGSLTFEREWSLFLPRRILSVVGGYLFGS